MEGKHKQRWRVERAGAALYRSAADDKHIGVDEVLGGYRLSQLL